MSGEYLSALFDAQGQSVASLSVLAGEVCSVIGQPSLRRLNHYLNAIRLEDPMVIKPKIIPVVFDGDQADIEQKWRLIKVNNGLFKVDPLENPFDCFMLTSFHHQSDRSKKIEELIRSYRSDQSGQTIFFGCTFTALGDVVLQVNDRIHVQELE